MRRSESSGHTTRRTSMNLDMELVAEAREVLSTDGTTDTVHKALEEIVLRARRRQAAEIDVSDLDLEALRATRTW